MGKALRILLGFLITAIMQSCNYGILYENPQPEGLKNLQSFPENFIGSYRNDSSEVTILILPNRIIKISDYDISVSKAEIDTMKDCKLIGDSLYISDFNESIFVDIHSDSVFGTLSNHDTLFTISDKNILRKYKQSCFINLNYDTGLWQVIKLSEQGNGIEFSIINQKVDYEKLNRLTPVKAFHEPNDSIANYQIKPTFKEFKAILKAGLFDTNEKYKKQVTNKL
jgi:hypothetical protein